MSKYLFNYAKEVDFSRALVEHLRKQHYFVQRIESGSTGLGIPDLYCVSPECQAVWLELKRIPKPCPTFCKVSWRKGQQHWLSTVSMYGQNAFTLVCFNDCILLVRGSEKNNPINTLEYSKAFSLSELTLLLQTLL